jgi:hypothetical protein
MNTNTLGKNGMTAQLLGLLLLLGGCSVSTDNGPDCRYNEAWLAGECSVEFAPPLVWPAGTWRGADTAGRDVLLLVSVGGMFQFVDGAHNQGSGYLAPETRVSSPFDLVTPIDQPFADGSTLANCNFSGSAVLRASMDLDLSCKTSAGLEFAETLALEFDPVYDRDASLETIAGNYRTLAENVLSIAPDGLLFLQDATSGCVVNGQVTVITATSNLYNVVLQYDGCTGMDERLNGSRFDGYAQLDDTAPPEALVIAVIGGVGDLLAATFERAVRL